MRTIAQRQLRNQNAAIIDAVAKGDSFVVTRNGTPVAELRPFSGARRRVVPKADLVVMLASAPRIGAEQFRKDLDRLIDQRLI